MVAEVKKLKKNDARLELLQDSIRDEEYSLMQIKTADTVL